MRKSGTCSQSQFEAVSGSLGGFMDAEDLADGRRRRLVETRWQLSERRELGSDGRDQGRYLRAGMSGLLGNC